MTPEQTAAERIAAAVAPMVCVQIGGCGPTPCGACSHEVARAGTAGVEAISAAGLVIVPAGRIAELLDANTREVERRRATRAALRLCLPHLVETVEALVQSHSTSFDWHLDEDLPADCEPEALLEAEAILAAIAAAKAALGEGARDG